MPISNKKQEWYYKQIRALDPEGTFVQVDLEKNIICYTSSLRSDESNQRDATPEEWVHALAMVLLINEPYNYPVSNLYHEKHYTHGRKGTLSDEVDLVIFDNEGLPYALWEFKSSSEYASDQESDIKYQLFGTAPLVGAPKLLVYATIHPNTSTPTITLVCIDYTKYKSYESWVEAGQPYSKVFPQEYQEIGYEPYINGGRIDLRMDCTQAEFRAVASTFHNEFFGEHPDNVLFVNLVKCLLAKIYDERNTQKGQKYKFQVFVRNGKEESAEEVFDRVNDELYIPAYKRYIDPGAGSSDEINPKEFSPERIKTVVKVLQGMSITKGAALRGDVIGAFFEEILRVGFKQDKGMYFTHDNLVCFMLEAVDLAGLTKSIWQKATHPENRLPYVIDPACGSGAFLLRAMHIISTAIRENKNELVVDYEAEQFYNARMSDNMPNYWAENFLYGLDPKFVMAITAKVNMVLHGDGSAHIFKQDAFKPLENFSDSKFRPAGEKQRTVPKTKYPYEVCETFDMVISNPPFGITLASDTRAVLSKTFSLKSSLSSEALFVERCFQLLKPNGRLALVVPESLLNTADAIDVRLFIYRMFWIRAIVALPRNIFIDTPTLTSLLFAQKKTSREITDWDDAWEAALSEARRKIKQAKVFLNRVSRSKKKTPVDVQNGILDILRPIVSESTWILKRGKNPAVLSFTLPRNIASTRDAANYYKQMLKLSGFDSIVQTFVFGKMIEKFDYEYPVFVVDEVGYKLSKRKERVRPNQLCRFIGVETGEEKPNLHLADEPVTLSFDTRNPERVIDYMKTMIRWR